MRPIRLAVLVSACTAISGAAQAGPAAREPHIGYVYPGGGRRGTTFEVAVGGQNLRGEVAVSVAYPALDRVDVAPAGGATYVGVATRHQARLLDAAADERDGEISWTTSDPSVATLCPQHAWQPSPSFGWRCA